MIVWEIVGKIVTITVGGGLAHLTDIPIKYIGNAKVRLFARYGTGSMLVFPAMLSLFETIIATTDIPDDQGEKRRLMWIFTASYFLGLVPFGVGVVIAHVFEQILGGESQ